MNKVWIAFLSWLCFANLAIADESHDIDLRLFGKNIIEEYDGCSYAFWQNNRDPHKDRFAYVLYAPFNDSEMLPAWMKVGDEILSLERVNPIPEGALKQKEFLLFTAFEKPYSLIVEILNQSRMGDDIVIKDARLTLVTPDKFPFTVRAKGRLGCPEMSRSAEIDGDAISLTNDASLQLSDIPRAIRRLVINDVETCDFQMTAGNAHRYALSDAMTLWELPCMLYAQNASSVFVVALNSNPDHAVILDVPAGPGREAAGSQEILNAVVTTRNAEIISVNNKFLWYNNLGCGHHARYQLRAMEGESIELVLLEFREKPQCDGELVDPENYPLVFSVLNDARFRSSTAL